MRLDTGPLHSTLESAARAAATACLHCGLPLSARRRGQGSEFCCAGCERVYALIQSCDLGRYYDLRRGPGLPVPEAPARSLAWFEATYAAAAAVPDTPHRFTFDLQGIHCAACVWILESLFRRHAGAVDLRLDPSLGRAEVLWTPGRGDLREWLHEVERFGYRVGPAGKSAAPASRALLVRMGVAVAMAMNVMVLSLSYYFGLSPKDGAVYSLFGRVSFALALVSVIVGGWVFFRAAFLGLRRGLAHLDLPIAAGICFAFGGSTWAYVAHGPQAAYFDTVTVFVALMLVGRWLQERVLERNRQALLADQGFQHFVTRRVREGRVEFVPASQVRAGDQIWIVPGDIVPVAGIVVGEAARVSLDWIDGESEPRDVDPGGALPAGARNAGAHTVRLAAQEGFDASRLRDLLSGPRAERDAAPGAGGQTWWRRVSAVYVSGVFLLAALGFLAWAGRDLDRAVQVTVSILVVACPCALGLAVPLAHELTHLALRRHGVLLRGGGFLDRAHDVRKVLFDKTGTLTLGRIEPTPAARRALETLAPLDRDALQALVARSNHPASRALALALGEQAPLAVDEDDIVTEEPGQGLSMRRHGRRYRLGRPAFAAPQGDAADESLDSTGTLFTADGRVLAAFTFEEALREDAEEEVRRLLHAGYELHLLSGDRPGKVARMAARLGLPPERARGGLSPQQKRARLAELDRRDTLFVGDGLNDAPSLAAAWCAATPAVDHPAIPARADFYFLGEGIAAVRRALLAARRLRGVVRANLALALVYNATALTLCFLGLVNPVVAALLMPASSIAIVSLTVFRLSGRRLSWMS